MRGRGVNEGPVKDARRTGPRPGQRWRRNAWQYRAIPRTQHPPVRETIPGRWLPLRFETSAGSCVSDVPQGEEYRSGRLMAPANAARGAYAPLCRLRWSRGSCAQESPPGTRPTAGWPQMHPERPLHRARGKPWTASVFRPAHDASTGAARFCRRGRCSH